MKAEEAQQETLSDDELLINEILLEGMLSGLFESCQVFKPSDLGHRTVLPFDKELAAAVSPELFRAVFRSAGTEGGPIPQEKFLLHFLVLLQEGKGEFEPLAEALDKPDRIGAVKRLARYLGVRFGTLYCLMALRMEETASLPGGSVLKHNGPFVEMAA